VHDGQGDINGDNVVAAQQVVERLALDRGAIIVDGYRGGVLGRCGKGLGRLLGARIDGFEGESGARFDGGEVL
jgi:hypothetical protein